MTERSRERIWIEKILVPLNQAGLENVMTAQLYHESVLHNEEGFSPEDLQEIRNIYQERLGGKILGLIEQGHKQQEDHDYE